MENKMVSLGEKFTNLNRNMTYANVTEKNQVLKSSKTQKFNISKLVKHQENRHNYKRRHLRNRSESNKNFFQLLPLKKLTYDFRNSQKKSTFWVRQRTRCDATSVLENQNPKFVGSKTAENYLLTHDTKHSLLIKLIEKSFAELDFGQ